MAGGLVNYVKLIEKRPPEITVRRWRAIRHGVMKVMGLHWHQHMLPKHFLPNANNVYKYQRRTPAYIKQRAWRTSRGRGITHQEILEETKRSLPKGLKADRGFYEDVFWRKYRETRERMLNAAGAPNTDLVYSGRLRAVATQVATIRTFEQRFKLIMPGTPYTPDRPRRPGMPPIAQEVTRLLDYEKTELAKLGKAFAVSELKKEN